MRRSTPSSLSGTPELSETNLYNAIIFTLGQMRPVSGRKAIVLISSGIDTLSKAGYDDLLRTAENSDTLIYVVSLARPSLAHLSKWNTQLRSRELTGARRETSSGDCQSVERSRIRSREYDRSFGDLRRYNGKPQSAVCDYLSLFERRRLEHTSHRARRTCQSEQRRASRDRRLERKNLSSQGGCSKATSPRLPPAGESLWGAVLGY